MFGRDHIWGEKAQGKHGRRSQVWARGRARAERFGSAALADGGRLSCFEAFASPCKKSPASEGGARASGKDTSGKDRGVDIPLGPIIP